MNDFLCGCDDCIDRDRDCRGSCSDIDEDICTGCLLWFSSGGQDNYNGGQDYAHGPIP